MTIAELKSDFEKQLKDFYPSTEIKNFYYHILTDLLKVPKITILSQTDKEIDENILRKIHEIVLKLRNNIPLQYILGKTDFYGMTLEINHNVLIPRPETEELVDWIINENKGKKITILDVGTGSGCIALALKKNMPLSTVAAVDNSAEALTVAKHNAEINKLAVEFIKADALKMKEVLPPSFDIIVSNPPYIPESEKHFVQKNVLQYEPHNALFIPENDPFIFYLAIADFAKASKHPVQLYFEINEGKAQELSNLLSKKGFKDVVVRKDINGKDRMLKCTYIC